MKRRYLLFIGLIMLCSTTHAERIVSSASSYYYNLVGPAPYFPSNSEAAAQAFFAGMMIAPPIGAFLGQYIGPFGPVAAGLVVIASPFIGVLKNDLARSSYNQHVASVCDYRVPFDCTCPKHKADYEYSIYNAPREVDVQGIQIETEWRARHHVDGKVNYDPKCDPESPYFDFEYADQFGD